MALRDRLRRSKTQTPEPAAPRGETREIGRSGTVNTRGFLASDERNAALVWPRNLEVYDEMRRTDTSVRWMLGLLTMPIRAADNEVMPASPSDEDREIAAFVEHALFRELENGFDEFVRQALLYLAYGHQVFERVASFGEVEFSYETEAGDEREVSREGFVVARLAQRLSRTIMRWVPDERQPSKLREIEQWLADGSGEANPAIPAQRLVIFVNEKEGDDWRGNSILRPAYLAYMNKRKLENIEAIALERSAGLPVVYPPGDADEEQLNAIEEAVSDMRQGENLYIIMPGPKPTPERDGWEIEDLAIQGDAQRSPDDAIRRYEAQIARNVWAEFMRLGQDGVGARATADTQQDPYYQAVSAVAGYVEDVIFEQIIMPLVDWNYGVSAYPRFKFGKIQSKNVQVLGTAIASLVKAGAIKPDFDLENYLRRILDAPERNLDDEPYEIPGQGLPPGADGGQDEPPDDEPDLPEGEGGQGKPRKMSERPLWRALRPEERHVALAQIDRQLDDFQADLADEAAFAANEPIARAQREVRQAVEIKAPELIAKLEVQPDLIAAAVERVLYSTYEAGRRELRSELRRQRGESMTFQEEGEPSTERTLAAKAAAIAASIAAGASRALRQWGLRLLETGTEPTGPGFDPHAAVRSEARGAALGSVNGAFADGRRDEMVARATEIETAVYSAILDDSTCQNCTLADGTEGPAGGLPGLPCPNPDCFGGGACRCMWIPVLRSADVVTPVAVAASEGRLTESIVALSDTTGRALQGLAEATSAEREIHIHNEVKTPSVEVRNEVKTPNVKVDVENRVETPEVNVTTKPQINVPAQPAPDVKVEPTIEVKPEPKRKRKLKVKRDEQGRLDRVVEE